MTIKRDPNIVRAERIRAIISMPEWDATIGKWLKDAEADALHNLQTAVEPFEVHRAQGAVGAIKGVNEQFTRAFQQEEAALNRKTKVKETN